MARPDPRKPPMTSSTSPPTDRPTRRRSAWLAAVALAPMLAAAGCATVRPYEREAFTRPEMDVDERQARAEAFRAHMRDSRRGAMSGGGAGGGGCGCN